MLAMSAPPSFARSPGSRPLRLPAAGGGLMGVLPLDGPVRLEARTDRQPLFDGRSTDLMAYRVQASGRELFNPLLLARRGQTVDVTLANRLGEDTTIHWHGLAVDERNDGSGMFPVRHGDEYVYRFRLENRAGLYWYHPHPHHRTGAQIHQGLGGLLLVSDAEDDALRRELGLAIGETEIPIVIQDKRVDARNRLRYEMGEDDWIGNRMLTNYTAEASLATRACLHRFRLLNGSNSRSYLIAFRQSDRLLPYKLIGTDGGLLARPVDIDRCFLAPAQRIDVLVDFGELLAGSSVVMASLPFDPMDNDGRAEASGMEHPGAPPPGSPLELLRIELAHSPCAPAKGPSVLGDLPVASRNAARVRRFRLHIDGVRWMINGYNYRDDMHAVKERVARGSREIWEISNDTRSMPHAMHVHGFQFRVVERRKSPPPVRALARGARGLMPQDEGLQDTVLVWPGETVAIALDFAQPFSGTQRYMFHCHNLEHEDQGMMLNFAVEDRA